MADKEFTVVRGDNFKQPFTVSLDQSRTLDGTESWRFSVRKTKSGPVLLSLASPITNGIEILGTFQPQVVFLPSTLGTTEFPPGEDESYVYDLEMTKGGQVETYAIDVLTVVGDVSR